jgi:hypothetical protein
MARGPTFVCVCVCVCVCECGCGRRRLILVRTHIRKPFTRFLTICALPPPWPRPHSAPVPFATTLTPCPLPCAQDGRVVFMLPWEGRVIAGTTDEPIEVGGCAGGRAGFLSRVGGPCRPPALTARLE